MNRFIKGLVVYSLAIAISCLLTMFILEFYPRELKQWEEVLIACTLGAFLATTLGRMVIP